MLDAPLAPPDAARLLAQLVLRRLGGQGSGNFGHAGRPGEVGGSGEGGGLIPSKEHGQRPEVPSRTQDSLARTEEILRGKLSEKRERSYAYNAKGDIEFTGIGSEHQVVSDSSQFEKIRGGVFTHSHPSDSSFSSKDLQLARKYELQEMRAVTSHGTYVIGPPTAGWKSVATNAFNDAVDKSFRHVSGYANNNVEDIARQFNLHYRYEPVKTRGLLRRPETIIHKAADAFIPKFSVAVKHAFAMGRRALGHPGFPNADAAANTIKLELLHTLHRTLLATLKAGADAGIELMPKMKDAEARALKGPGPALKMKFDVNDPRAIAWAHEHGAELATQISDTTRDAIREAVADSLEGDGIQEMWEIIREAVGDDERAELIARTETMIAANEGQREGWHQAIEAGLLPPDVQKTWIATGDSDVCPECEALDGTVVGLDEEYPNDGGDGPPLHPRCRCTEGIVGEE